jgi:hypothetical protein
VVVVSVAVVVVTVDSEVVGLMMGLTIGSTTVEPMSINVVMIGPMMPVASVVVVIVSTEVEVDVMSSTDVVVDSSAEDVVTTEVVEVVIGVSGKQMRWIVSGSLGSSWHEVPGQQA